MISHAAIEISGLSKKYSLGRRNAALWRREGVGEKSTIDALSDINIRVGAGKIFVIMGLSGSGKSTLLRCLNRIIEPTSGSVIINGNDITRLDKGALRRVRQTQLSMVFQHFALLPHLSVLENVAFGLRISGLPYKERSERARKILGLVGLSDWAERKPSALSGGMRQRVGIARALVMDAPILLMDEPFSALDPLIRAEMQQELLRLQRTLKKTIVFVTHDPKEAQILADEIAILRDGVVVQQGTTEDVMLNPADDYVRQFVASVDRLSVLTAGQAVEPDYPAGVLNEGLNTFDPPVRWVASGAAVVNEQNRLVGVVTRPAKELQTIDEWRREISRDFVTVLSDTPVADYRSNLLHSGLPVFVTTPDGKYVGASTASSILRA